MGINDLDKDFEQLQQFSADQEEKKFKERIYNLDLSLDFLKTLSQDKLSFVHIRLHNALSYKHPFAPIEQIKEVHNLVASLLDNHQIYDELDS